jgi:enamine deaminase RidA (YjgF/YER057c/UK114 family)
MNLFDDELRKAMERREPGEDFTARILAKVKEEESRKGRSWRAVFRQSIWQAGYARLAWAAALLVIFSGLIGYRQHARAAEGRAAKEQLLTAMHIAGTQLHEAQLRVKRIEFPEVVTQ